MLPKNTIRMGAHLNLTKITKASYAILAALFTAHFLNHVYTGVLSPFLPLIRDELSLSLTQAGILTSAVIVTMTSFHLVVGYLADKNLREIMISISVIGAGISVLLMSFAPSFLFLAIIQVVLGIAVSGYHPSSFPAVADAFPKKARAKAVGVSAMGGLIGMALVPILGALLLVIYSDWRASLVILGLLGVILFVPVTLLLRYSKSNETPVENDDNEIDGPQEWTRNFGLVVLLSGLRGIPFRCTTLLMPLYLAVSYGYEPVWAGSLTTVMLVAGMFAEVIAAPISDRTGKRVRFMTLSIGLLAPLLLLLNFRLNPIMLALVLIGIGFFYFFGVPPGQAYQTEVCPSQTKGLAFGVLFSIGAIPGAIAPVIFGAIGDAYGLDASILFLVGTTIIATIVSLFLKEDHAIHVEPRIAE